MRIVKVITVFTGSILVYIRRFEDREDLGVFRVVGGSGDIGVFRRRVGVGLRVIMFI